jgi:hypothetical protein
MQNEICANCGYADGLHHYETNQCPENGEVAPGKVQRWSATIFSTTLRVPAAFLEAVREYVDVAEATMDFGDFQDNAREALQKYIKTRDSIRAMLDQIKGA